MACRVNERFDSFRTNEKSFIGLLDWVGFDSLFFSNVQIMALRYADESLPSSSENKGP
jgi:hypothetical protein